MKDKIDKTYHWWPLRIFSIFNGQLRSSRENLHLLSAKPVQILHVSSRVKRQWSMAIMALLATMTSSCINEDVENYTVGQPTMLTRFIISVGNEHGASPYFTKQTAAVAQAQVTPVFRGMQDIVMIPFNIGSSSKITTSHSRLSFNLILPAAQSIPTAPADNAIASLNASSQSQVYQDVSIANGTNAFLCYGKATGEDNMANGSLDYTGLETGDPSDITFTPKAIYTPADPSTLTPPAEGTALAEYLTSIANTTGWSTGNVKFRLLQQSFQSQHAGSATNALATLQKLYDAISIEPSSTLRNAIIASMKIGDGADDKLHLDTNGKLEWNDGVSFKNYPASVGGTDLDLPDGAAYLWWDNIHNEFKNFSDGNVILDNVDNRPQGTDPETFALGTGVDLMHYATPAPLYYRANTKIKVSDETQLEHYQSTETWAEVLAHYDAGDGSVNPTTESVALQSSLEYAVGRMDFAVKASAATLPDKENEPTDASDLELTGVLINEQYAVDYEFNSIGTEAYIIYDNNINPADATTTPVTPITLETNREKTGNYILNHTLVLQSKMDENVDIYLEFKNNSDHDITTLTGLVPPGCKLYLAGTLTLTTGQHYVFEQDKVTTFIATISDLKNASNVVPSMEVGQPFAVQVAIKEWDEISTEDHDLYNW